MRRAEVRPIDVAIVGLAFVIGQQEAWFPLGGGFSHLVGPPIAFSVASALVALALLWRRLAPLTVAVFVNGVLATYCLVFGSPDGLVALVPVSVSLYAVGRYADLPRLSAALAITFVGSLVHLWRDPQPPLPLGPELLFFAALLASGLLGRAVASFRRDVQVLRLRAARLELEREAQAREAVVAERARIAHELHDLVGHGLSLIVLQVVGAQGALEQNRLDATVDQLSRAEATARGTLVEMRRLLAVVGDEGTMLAPPPGLADIAGLVETVRGEGLPVQLELPALMADLPSGVGLTAYRIVQEALTNVMKHADRGASTRVIVERADGQLSVDVRDSGGGRSIADPAGLGLAGMRERVAIFGGTLDVGPTDDGGFRLHARLPLDPAPV
jgi:signal transduction histidine kinase